MSQSYILSQPKSVRSQLFQGKTQPIQYNKTVRSFVCSR